MKIRRLVFGVLALVGLIAANISAQTPECAAKSQRLSALETDLKSDQNAESLKAFWRDVENTGTPIVERIPNNQADVLVTFVWRSSSSAKQVFIFPQIESTAASDKMKMSRLLDTNLWYKTYCLPEDSRFTYGFYEALTIIENDSPLKHVDQLKADQFNSRRFEFPPHDSAEGGTPVVFSVFESSHSPDRSWSITDPAAQRGTVETKTILSKVLGKQWRVWVYRSPPSVEGAKPSALLILFDGFDYLHEIPTPTILDNLVRAKQIPELVAVLVDNPPQTRTQDLFCNDRFDEFVATELVPWARQQYGVNPTPGQSIVGGSSLGGLAAACTALRYPDVFGNVLSESGAFWWNDPKPIGSTHAEPHSSDEIRASVRPLPTISRQDEYSPVVDVLRGVSALEGPSRRHPVLGSWFIHRVSIGCHFSFASERVPCGERVHVISPANNPPILDGNDGHESVVIRSSRFDGLAMNLIFQSDHAAFLVMVNRKSITFFKHDVVAVTRVGSNQVFSPANRCRPTGEPI
jgi:enterochelin esterase-like enzyme